MYFFQKAKGDNSYANNFVRAEWDFCEAVEDLLTSRVVILMFIDKADIK